MPRLANPFIPTPPRPMAPDARAALAGTTPWGAAPVAWANGQTIYSSIKTVKVKRRHPRVAFLQLPALAH